ncbi:MAG: MogA/MoaB family molybdenum cofactor biosynthesis protein [Thermoflavifilum sp.]|nr:MogA/MoaB family molybdenum cofactor biosynthesis protein [Thermoflavifilum sp.]MCL6515055.1 MogA/MoaB family molybdenum cofactor biosynthesis protein [Alicyclobacillus sp.]
MPHPEAARRGPAAVVTVSDSVAAGTRVDTGGDNAERKLAHHGFHVAWRITVPDERDQISAALRQLCDEGARLIITTGGTGLGPRDVTPEATRDVIDREVPGMAEAMRAESLRFTPFAMTSRQVVGVRGQTLIINLPGSPRGVEQCLDVVLPVVPHVLDLLAGRTRHE